MIDYDIQRPRKVCLCKGVDKNTIIESVQMGNDTIEKVALDTLATTGCGSCHTAVQKIIEETLSP